MNPARRVALAALAAGWALAHGAAMAQADNSNSLTVPENLWNALFERAAPAPEVLSPLEEALRRPTGDRHAQALSAEELGLLYGSWTSGDAVDPSAP